MANTPTTIAMYAAAHLDIGFSFTGHANDLFVLRALLPEKLRRAQFVACISHWHQQFYRRFVDLPDSKLPVIRCGVATSDRAQPLPAWVASDSGRSIQILSVGRLVPKKGMDTLIRAIVLLGSEFPVRCDIVGDGPLRAELEALVASNGAHDRVRLHGAQVNSEVLHLVRACDIFVLACRRDAATGDQDGIPVSLMEAMAASRCVITSDLAPITELVIDGETGVCVPEANAEALAAAIRRLAGDPKLRQQLAERGRLHVSQEFDRGINARRLCGLFASCVERVRRAPSTTEPAVASRT